MNYSEEAPKLPLFPFIAGDLVLIATAVLIALRSPSPLGPGPLLAITICVVFGAALLVVPFLANYARRQDAELTERQNQIAALARTTTDSAEQLSIAAASLHGISESSKQNLDLIGKLPAQLQERIDLLTQQLAGSAIASQASIKEDLSRLDAATEKVSRTLAKLDDATKTKSDALAAVETDLADALARATTQIDALVATARSTAARLSEQQPSVIAVAPPAPTPAIPAADPVTSVSATVHETAPVEPKAKPHATKSKVKAAAPQSAPTGDAGSDHALPAPSAPVNEPAPPSVPVIDPEPAAHLETPPPAPIDPEPAASPDTASAAETFTSVEPDAADVPVDEPPAPKPPRARKAKPADDIGFDLGLTSDTQESAESAVTSDGFTRLIATAYIGIGNKLFIRGEGPGLSWEKGVPLQFVSIGKWRWETPDASAPIEAKLYKNDQVECVGLGPLTLEPGRQYEVNAGF